MAEDTVITGIGNFTADKQMHAEVDAEIRRVYADTDYLRPDPRDVIADVLETVRADIRDRADDQGDCNKVDECAAKAIVLRRLADWLEGR